MVCPIYRTVVFLSVLSVCDVVYCGQMVGWIKMPLGVEVGLGPGHIVLDWDPAAPTFQPTLLWNGRPSQLLLSIVESVFFWITFPLSIIDTEALMRRDVRQVLVYFVYE